MHIALFLSGLAGGGAQRRMLALARGFAARGHRVTLLPVRGEGPFARFAPPDVEIIAVGGRWLTWPVIRTHRALSVLLATCALARQLRALQPDVVLSASDPANLAALWARALARLAIAVVPTVNIDHTAALGRRSVAVRFCLRRLLARAYRGADAVIAISSGTSEAVRRLTGLPAQRVATIYNPVDTEMIADLAAAAPPHPWLAAPQVPVILAVGKLKPQKDYPTLLRAFARVRSQRPVRLLVLGEGDRRPAIERLAHQLAIAPDVALPGFVDNPFAGMARAAVLVLSSAWEGLSNVLLEALACGCPVVSTDCRSGPREILDGGRYGALVPVGDDAAMARAIMATLDAPPAREHLKARAATFSVATAVEAYLRVIEAAVARRRRDPQQGLTRSSAAPDDGGEPPSPPFAVRVEAP
ncbi:MAG: glycosyltransferase [Alphaproteobacteria bacterium]|nr:glycosyltransferase [Alphaproteobacteria bacterium]